MKGYDKRWAFVAAIGALVAAGAAGGLVVTSLGGAPSDASVSDGVAARPVFAVAQVGGLATSGLPVVPVSADDAGRLVGEPVFTGGEEGEDHDVLVWLRYCQFQNSPGLSSTYAGDNVLRYAPPRWDESSSERPSPWYADRYGEPIVTEDIPVGEAAHAAWRSEGAAPGETVTLLLVRFDPQDLPPLTREFAHDGIVAFSDTSTYGCTGVVTAQEAETAGFEGGASVPGLNNDTLRVVDLVHSGAWNPRWVVRDFLTPELLPVPAAS